MMASKPPALVMPDGRPLTRDNLAVEIAAPARTSVRTIQSGHPAQGLTPQKLGRLLREAEDGDATAYYELAEEMEEKDLHYLAVLRTRKLAVARLPIEVEPADDSEEAKKDAALIKTWLKRDMLQLELFDMLDAIGKGVSTTELVWDMKPDLWQPSKLHWRDPRWFEFDRVNGTDLLLRGGESGYGEPSPLPAGKFITHYHPSKSGLPIRSGLARIAAWGYMFKNFAIKDWVTFLESFGHPLRIGKYGPNESEENKNILHRALLELGSDAAAAFPETMSVEFVDRKAGTAPNDLWRSKAEYIDDQLSKAVLGQTNTTDAKAGGIGSGQAQVHDGVRGDIEDFDAMMLAGTLNRDVVVPMVMFNHGPRKAYPRLLIGRPDEVDVAVEIDSAGKLASLGVQIDGEEMRERAGLPAAKSPETALRPGAGATVAQEPVEARGSEKAPPARKNAPPALLDPFKPASGPDRSELNRTNSDGEPDAIDLTTDQALEDWDLQMEPVLADVDRLVGEAADLSELQQSLAALAEKLDPALIAQRLAQAMFSARLSGQGDQPGARGDAPGRES